MHKSDSSKKTCSKALIKGYLRPDGTYYVSVPKKIIEEFSLKGGEYFLMKAKSEKKKIILKLVEFLDDQEDLE